MGRVHVYVGRGVPGLSEVVCVVGQVRVWSACRVVECSAFSVGDSMGLVHTHCETRKVGPRQRRGRHLGLSIFWSMDEGFMLVSCLRLTVSVCEDKSSFQTDPHCQVVKPSDSVFPSGLRSPSSGRTHHFEVEMFYKVLVGPHHRAWTPRPMSPQTSPSWGTRAFRLRRHSILMGREVKPTATLGQ